MGLLLGGAMFYMVLFVNSLQLIIHLPIFNIIVPGNVSLFFSYLLPAATYDVLSSDYTLKVAFNYDEDE